MEIQELTNDEFQNYINTFFQSSYYQTPEYAFVVSKEKKECLLLGLKNDQNILLGATFLFLETSGKYKKAFAPKGFLIDYYDSNLFQLFTQKIKKYLNKRNIISVTINPMIIKNTYNLPKNTVTSNNYFDIVFKNFKALGYKHLGFSSYFEGLTPRYMAMINLNQPYYQLFQTIKKEYRTKIRSAVKRGIQVFQGTEQELPYLYQNIDKKFKKDLTYYQNLYHYFSKHEKIDFFYTILNTQAYLSYTQNNLTIQQQKVNTLILKITQEKQQREIYIEEKMKEDKLLAFYKHELEKALKLIQQYPNGIVTAAALIIKDKKQISLVAESYNPAFKKFNSKHLLMWKLCEKYNQEGYQVFEFGSVTSPLLASNPYQGLTDFKVNFQSLIVEYIGDFELITNPTLYFLDKNGLALSKK